jgi:hypothetical protein
MATKTMKVVLYAKALRARHNAEIGEAVDVDVDNAKAYIAAGAARAVKGGGGAGSSGLALKTKDELIELAKERDVQVTRADGKEGDPLKADYVRALSA